MKGRFSRIACSLATATLLPLAACGDDPASDRARFADASLEQKARALGAAGGTDAAMAMLVAGFLDFIPPESTCPRVTRSGDTLTATTGCTDADGNRLSGRIIATNLPSLLGGGNDPTRPIEVMFEGYRVEGAGEDLALDGTVIFRPDGSQAASMRLTLAGIEVATEATWRPAAGEQQAADAGSTIEVTGLGLAEIEGRWSMSGNAPSGALALHGADVLEANFDLAAGGCVPLTVDGEAAGQLCGD